MDTIKIGIIGTGRVAQHFVEDARQVKGVEITVICNPQLESAADFAKKNNIEHYTDHMEKMAAYVDAVYIALPREKHYTYAKRMLNIGKHVMCLNPMTFSKARAEELCRLAQEKERILMEAIETEYCPGFQAVIDIAKSGRIGDLVDIEATYTHLMPVNSRSFRDRVCGGSLTQFGYYALLPAMMLFGTEYEKTFFCAKYFKTGVDSYAKVFLCYGDKMATCNTGIGVKSEGQLIISGTRGYILVEDPWWITRKFQVRYEDSNRVEGYDYPFEGKGMVYTIEKFRDRIHAGESLTMISARRHIAMVEIVEKFLKSRPTEQLDQFVTDEEKEQVRIWAHRGCSRRFPESTLLSYEEAAKLPGITGVEMDVQLTKDGEVVVIHDEDVQRTTDGIGAVEGYTLEEIKKLNIPYGEEKLKIPTLREVLDTLAPYCKQNGLLINIELKTRFVRYEGIEEKVLDIVADSGLSDYIVYSSFVPESLSIIKEKNPGAKTGMLAADLADCIDGMKEVGADAVHPYVGGLQQSLPDEYADIPVRVWNMEEEFYGMGNFHKGEDFRDYAFFGATDIITNEPEKYLCEKPME